MSIVGGIRNALKLHDSTQKHEHGGLGHIKCVGYLVNIFFTCVYIIMFNCCAFSVMTK